MHVLLSLLYLWFVRRKDFTDLAHPPTRLPTPGLQFYQLFLCFTSFSYVTIPFFVHFTETVSAFYINLIHHFDFFVDFSIDRILIFSPCS